MRRVGEVCWGVFRRNVVDQTADGEDGLVVPSRAVRNAAIYEVSARERAQQRSNAAFGSNGTLEIVKAQVVSESTHKEIPGQIHFHSVVLLFPMCVVGF